MQSESRDVVLGLYHDMWNCYFIHLWVWGGIAGSVIIIFILTGCLCVGRICYRRGRQSWKKHQEKRDQLRIELRESREQRLKAQRITSTSHRRRKIRHSNGYHN